MANQGSARQDRPTDQSQPVSVQRSRSGREARRPPRPLESRSSSGSRPRSSKTARCTTGWKRRRMGIRSWRRRSSAEASSRTSSRRSVTFRACRTFSPSPGVIRKNVPKRRRGRSDGVPAESRSERCPCHPVERKTPCHPEERSDEGSGADGRSDPSLRSG